MTDVAVIGAGMAGLTVARELSRFANVKIFEKSRGPGGRMATRRGGGYTFDHGAQFFKARSQGFRELASQLQSAGILESWDGRFAEFDQGKLIKRRQWDSSHPHYVGIPSMNAVGKYLGQELEIMTATRVLNMQREDNGWLLNDENMACLGYFDWVIFSVPAEQAAQVVPAEASFSSKLDSLSMQPCYSLMLGFDRELDLSFDAALVKNAAISWISVDSSKPGRPCGMSMVVHSANQWAAENMEKNRDWIMDVLLSASCKVAGAEVSKADHVALHRWRYANMPARGPEQFFVDQEWQIAACGDWCIQGKVEAAYLSGKAASAKILSLL